MFPASQRLFNTEIPFYLTILLNISLSHFKIPFPHIFYSIPSNFILLYPIVLSYFALYLYFMLSYYSVSF